MVWFENAAAIQGKIRVEIKDDVSGEIHYAGQVSAADYQRVLYAARHDQAQLLNIASRLRNGMHLDDLPTEATSPQDKELAAQRARDLLLTHLSDEQQEQFESKGWFRVVGSNGGVYRVTNAKNSNGGHTYNVVIESPSPEPVRDWQGKVLGRGTQLCVVHSRGPWDVEPCPDDDTLLAQKLMLETDAEGFERLAGKWAANPAEEWVGHPKLRLEDD